MHSTGCTAASRTLLVPLPAGSQQGNRGLRLLHGGHRLLESAPTSCSSWSWLADASCSPPAASTRAHGLRPFVPTQKCTPRPLSWCTKQHQEEQPKPNRPTSHPTQRNPTDP